MTSLNKVLMLGGIPLLIISGALSAILVSGQNAEIFHDYIEVAARDYRYIEIYISKPSTIIIIKAYIYTPAGDRSDIDIEIIRPDGSIELAKRRYQSTFEYKLVASITGTYKLLLDNSYSILSPKIVDLAIMKYPPPTTITRYITHTITETKTLTQPPITITKTTTQTITKTKTVAVISMKNLSSVLAIAIALLIIGLAIGFFIGRR